MVCCKENEACSYILGLFEECTLIGRFLCGCALEWQYKVDPARDGAGRPVDHASRLTAPHTLKLVHQGQKETLTRPIRPVSHHHLPTNKLTETAVFIFSTGLLHRREGHCEGTDVHEEAGRVRGKQCLQKRPLAWRGGGVSRLLPSCFCRALLYDYWL